MRHAEESLLDTEPAQLELQGLAGRLAAQQHHHNAIERGLEMQGLLPNYCADVCRMLLQAHSTSWLNVRSKHEHTSLQVALQTQAAMETVIQA